MNVSLRGFRAFRSRPASRRQRSDLVTLAHITEQSCLSPGRYGRPRMTEELKRDKPEPLAVPDAPNETWSFTARQAFA